MQISFMNIKDMVLNSLSLRWMGLLNITGTLQLYRHVVYVTFEQNGYLVNLPIWRRLQLIRIIAIMMHLKP